MAIPRNTKLAALALILSAIANLLAIAVDGWAFHEFFNGPLFARLLATTWLGFHGMWLMLIAWLVWALLGGKPIRPTLLMVSALLAAFLIWDLTANGLELVQLFQGIELLCILAAYRSAAPTPLAGSLS